MIWRETFEIVVEHFTRSTHHGVLPIRDDDNLNISDIASRATDSSILLGYPVFKMETGRSSPDEGEIVQENWIAPELDNFPLWTTTTWKLGEMTLRSETEATSIVPAALPQEAFPSPGGLRREDTFGASEASDGSARLASDSIESDFGMG